MAKAQKQKSGCLTPIIALMLILGLSSLGNKKENKQADVSTPQETQIETTEQATETTAETESETMPETTETETEATTEPETESETESETEPPTEAPTEKAIETQPVVDRNYISNHENEIVAVAKMTLDNFISGYDISLAPQLWNIALYDNDGAVMATTDITYNGTSYGYVYVGTLNLDKNGKVESATPHFVYAMGALFGDDGYCQDLIGAMNALAG